VPETLLAAADLMKQQAIKNQALLCINYCIPVVFPVTPAAAEYLSAGVETPIQSTSYHTLSQDDKL
jgi:hypothetical protein